MEKTDWTESTESRYKLNLFVENDTGVVRGGEGDRCVQT